jgi:DNA-binding CsgD family transcriptional regulator
MARNTTSVLVIAAQSNFARALCQLLAVDPELDQIDPDIIVLDVDGQGLTPSILPHGLADGSNGYIVKDVEPAELIRALKGSVAGAGVPSRRAHRLTLREHDVIRLIAQGLSNREISDRLNLSDKTVKNHISRIFSKLNIATRSQAAVHAVRAGLV